LQRLREELARNGPDLPVYWGNRNWHPFLEDTLRQMRSDGVRRALTFVTSAFSSYSGCRQYREDIDRARQTIGPDAPEVDKIRVFFNHPGFIAPMVENVAEALKSVGVSPAASSDIKIIFTAHSVPVSMARSSRYQQQIEEASRLVAEALHLQNWSIAWQSRSGPPSQPWLEPDIGDVLTCTRFPNIVIVPIGFISDHMEVLYDLDHEARAICDGRGIRMARAATVGAHPRFIRMIRELVLERIDAPADRDACPVDCCPPPARPTAPPQLTNLA
jgi:ferrochelatase